MHLESPNASVSTDQINLAHAVAIRYKSYHPRFLKGFTSDDCRSLANMVLALALTDGSVNDKQILRSVENAMFCELRRQKKRAQREEAISLDEFGEPLFSIRDLRTAQSLNPRGCRQVDDAPLASGFVSALGEVCESAVRQNQQSHPLHAEYVGAAGLSRDLVSQSLEDRTRAAKIQENSDLRRLRMAA